MFRQNVWSKILTKVSSKSLVKMSRQKSRQNVSSKCLFKMSHQNVSSNNFSSTCTIKRSHQNVSSKFLIKMAHQNVSSKCLFKMSCQNIASKCFVKMSQPSSIIRHQSSIISNLLHCLTLEQGWVSQTSIISNYDHRQQTKDIQSDGHSLCDIRYPPNLLNPRLPADGNL